MLSRSSRDSPGRAWPRARAILPEACSRIRARSISMNSSKVSCSGLLPMYAPLRSASTLSAIHPSAWKGNSENFAFWGFSEVRLRIHRQFIAPCYRGGVVQLKAGLITPPLVKGDAHEEAHRVVVECGGPDGGDAGDERSACVRGEAMELCRSHPGK